MCLLSFFKVLGAGGGEEGGAQMEMANVVSRLSTTSRCILGTDMVSELQSGSAVCDSPQPSHLAQSSQMGTLKCGVGGGAPQPLSSRASSCLAGSAWTILGGYLSCLLVKGSRLVAGDGTPMAYIEFLWGFAV